MSGLSGLPAASEPWALALAEYSAEVTGALLLGGDDNWHKASAAYDKAVTAQRHFMAGWRAGSSGAATELDYYEEG